MSVNKTMASEADSLCAGEYVTVPVIFIYLRVSNEYNIVNRDFRVL